jgi:hypothetical protein
MKAFYVALFFCVVLTVCWAGSLEELFKEPKEQDQELIDFAERYYEVDFLYKANCELLVTSEFSVV